MTKNISIHAPREGSDRGLQKSPALPGPFLSTLPARGATVTDAAIYQWECDFYPRSPRGERLDGLGQVPFDAVFLSTLPARGATEQRGAVVEDFQQFLSTLPARGATVRPFTWDIQPMISIHAPREGSDPEPPGGYERPGHFYPRSPRGERPAWQSPADALLWISIHAPREGSDGGQRPAGPGRRDFYPRSPRGERRGGMVRDQQRTAISIHAPREGSDRSSARIR